MGRPLIFLFVLLFAGAAHADPVSITAAVVGSYVATSAGVIAALGAFGAAVAGFVVSTAISQIGSRMFGTQPKAPDFGSEASGRALTVRSSIESHKVIYGTAKVSGPLVFVKTVDSGYVGMGSLPGNDTGANKFLHMVIALAGHEVEEIGDVYINDRRCTLDGSGFVQEEPYNYNDGNGIKFVRVKKHLGTADQTADADLISEAGFTADHRLRGIAYAYIRLHWNPNVFPQGIPNFAFVVKGKKLYDPRTTTTAWSDNAALCVRDYLANSYGFSCSASEIDDTYFNAAANICDEDVTLSTGGTQNRYTCNGVVDTAAAPLDNLAGLLSSLAGAVTYVQGKFRLHAGAYDTPAGAITADMLAGPIKGELRTPRKDLFNAVKGTYVDPNRSWLPTDFPFVTNSTYETQDGGERIYRDVELPFTNHPEAAQRIGKILLEKARQGIKVELPLNHSALKYSVYDTVTFSDDGFGWTDKVFRIQKVSTTGTGPITLYLQEESSASYDWNSGEATTVDAAPDTNLPDPFTVLPPGSPAVTESLYAPLDGSAAKSKATVTWGASADVFVTQYQLERKLAADTDYTLVGRTSGTTLEALDVPEGTNIFRVKALNSLGVSSPYASSTAEIFGLTRPPNSLFEFSLNAIHNNAHLSWDQSEDLDVRIGGKIRLRYTPELVSPSWSAAVDLGPALPGVATQATVPLLNGTYLIKAVDSSGNESRIASTIKSTVANVVNMNFVAESVQHPAFAGTILDYGFYPSMVILGGALELNSLGLFDSAPGDFDDATGYFDSGTSGFVTLGDYFFGDPAATHIDVGKVTTSRVTALVTAEIYDPSNNFDAAAGNFDERLGLFDGDDLTGLDVILYVSTSDDLVTWSDYRKFFVGDYTCRGYRFWLSVINRSDENSLNVRITQLSVTVDVPDVTETGTITTSGSGVTAVPFTRTYIVTPDVGVTIQGAATGDYPVIQNITPTGFDLGVKDSGGSFIARAAAWAASGY